MTTIMNENTPEAIPTAQTNEPLHTHLKPRLKVLIAEDHAINQEIIKAILKHQGCEISIVNNGLEVIELLTHETFDVILMDMQMPVMDGCQATKEIRKHEKISGGRTRIIAITANAKKSDQEICLAAGMDDYITKPLDAQILIAKLTPGSTQDEAEITHNEKQKLSETSASIFNVESLKGRVLGHSIASTKMVHMFLKELPSSLENLDLALKVNDIDEIAKLAHRMGGVAAMLGAEQMAFIAEELEADARVGATKALPNLIARMHLASTSLKDKLLQFVMEN